MSVRHALLGLLEPSPRHGYELKRLFDGYFAVDRPLAFGQVYATLGRLTRDGEVVVAGVEQGEGPERRRYAITPLGERALASWLREPAEPEPHLQATLFTKVTLAVLTGRSAVDLLDRQRRAHLARMRELTTLRRSAPVPVALLADYALFHLEADLRWIELTVARASELASHLPVIPARSVAVGDPHPTESPSTESPSTGSPRRSTPAPATPALDPETRP
jgi:DNA-binding PadR family transcriptional regulator